MSTKRGQTKKRSGRGKARGEDRGDRVEVHWRLLAASESERRQAARDIVAVLLTQPQPPVEPHLIPANPARNGDWKTAQSAKPISYEEARSRFAGIQWAPEPDGIRILLSNGEVLKPNLGNFGPSRRRVGSMKELGPDRRRRKPMVINRRPGKGGLQRRALSPNQLNPTEGLEKFGEITWRRVADGARVGVLEINPDGNTIQASRISADDRNETLIAQVEPCLAMAERYPEELQVRMLLLSETMSGTREVRPDRAGPPPPGHPERDDMLIVDSAIEAGWLEHIIWRDGDRIARDVLPGETLLQRWQRNGVGLWLASQGRQMDFVRDRLMLRSMMVISSEERNNSNRRMQLGAINKGPMQGLGWPGPVGFGFVKNPVTKEREPDPEQWPGILRAFELADSGDCMDKKGGLSTRRVTEKLAEEGFPFDHDRVRKILKDPIYATGEYTTKIRGIPTEQKPVALDNPVPLDRFHRVQELLALRQGPTKRTPLGQFLLNYVETVHARCQEERKGGRAPLIKGFWRKEVNHLRYRHAWCPPSCKHKGYTWSLEELEHPIVAELRKLVENDELLEEIAAATQHDVVNGRTRLSDQDREELQHEIDDLRGQQLAMTDDYVAECGRGRKAELASYTSMHSRFQVRIDRLTKRLEADRRAAAEADRGNEHDASGQSDLRSAFLELMTIETPEDPQKMALRARLFQRCVSKVIIDEGGEGELEITLEGHLVPEGTPLSGCDPITASNDLLTAYVRRGAEENVSTVESGAADDCKTDLPAGPDKSVLQSEYGRLVELPSTRELMRVARNTLASKSWAGRRGPASRGDYPGWRMRITGGRQ
jgi:hypothetical protein